MSTFAFTDRHRLCMEIKKREEALKLSALKNGDERAFNYFYDKYGLQLYRKLYGMAREETVAEELLQELFMKIWERREQIDPSQPFGAYLHRIAERMIYDHFRRLKREAELQREMVLQQTERSDTDVQETWMSDMNSYIWDAVDQLPPQQRRIFTLCKLEGRSYEEVSGLLGITTATVNTHITRATQTVRDYLIKKHRSALAAVSIYCAVINVYL